LLLAAPLAVPMPAAAQGDVLDQLEAMHGHMDEALGLDYFTRMDEARQMFEEVAASGEDLLARLGPDHELATDVLRAIGTANFYAAQYHDSEWNQPKAQERERAWLMRAVETLAPVMERLGAVDGPHYEFRGAAGQLFNHALNDNLPQLREWSALRVQANRYRVQAFPDDGFEREMLAEALADHGRLFDDQAMVAEAAALLASIPEDPAPASASKPVPMQVRPF
jgi:hypothetical protein